MKQKDFLFLSIVCLIINSCGGAAAPTAVDIGFGVTKAFLINAPAYSCYALGTASQSGTAATSDVSAYYFSFGNPTLTLKDLSTTVSIATITLSMSHQNLEGGKYSCTIATTELAAVFGTQTGTAPSITLFPFSGTLNSSVSVVPSSSQTICSAMVCGGVKVIKDATGFTAPLKVTVVGFLTQQGSSAPIPVKTTSYLSVEYIP